MDAAKDVAGRVVSAAQSVAKAVSYLPQGLRDGASKAMQQATTLLETVRKVRKRLDEVLLQVTVVCGNVLCFSVSIHPCCVCRLMFHMTCLEVLWPPSAK